MSVAEINSCEYTYLAEISEPSSNELLLVIEETTVGEEITQERLEAESPEIQGLLSGCRQIVHSASCRSFKLVWNSYVSYHVRNESYATNEPFPSNRDGRTIIKRTQSHYLTYIHQSTIANNDYPGPLIHWTIFSLDHIIDIVSTEEPIINQNAT